MPHAYLRNVTACDDFPIYRGKQYSVTVIKATVYKTAAATGNAVGQNAIKVDLGGVSFAVSRISRQYFACVLFEHLRFDFKPSFFQKQTLISYLFLDYYFPDVVFRLLFPVGLYLYPFRSIMRAVIRQKFGRRITLFVAEYDFHVIPDEFGQQRGCKRNRRTLYDKRIYFVYVNSPFGFAPHY